VKLFQIEEPDGGPTDPNAPGAAVGIDASSAEVEVALSVGGNAVILGDREGFEQMVPVPELAAAKPEWQQIFESARVRAERALARPVTHVVIALGRTPDADTANKLHDAAQSAGLEVLRMAAAAELPAASVPVLAAAMLAEDLAPPPGRDS
jgi:hypothetical protein